MAWFPRKSLLEPDSLRRMEGLSGAAAYLQGPSGCGKSHKAFGLGVACAAVVNGFVLIYDPTGDMGAYHIGSQRYYEQECDNAETPEDREYAATMLDFYRYRVIRHAGRNADKFFDDFAEIVGDGESKPTIYGAVIVDESALARKQRELLETLGPLARNAKVFLIVTGQRWMATPPQIRAITRYRIPWNCGDTTGDPELEQLKSSGFEFTKPMSAKMPASERWYHCVFYGREGAEHRAFNPYLAPHPDWSILPAYPTIVRAMRVV